MEVIKETTTTTRQSVVAPGLSVIYDINTTAGSNMISASGRVYKDGLDIGHCYGNSDMLDITTVIRTGRLILEEQQQLSRKMYEDLEEILIPKS